MPSKDERAARKGKAAEQLIAAVCVLATGTELNALTALVDDEGVDVAFKRRDGTRTLDVQVKTRFSDEQGSKQLREQHRLTAVVRAATFRVREDFWLLFAAVDAARGVVDQAWLVPSGRFDELAGHQVVRGQVRRRFSASTKPTSKTSGASSESTVRTCLARSSTSCARLSLSRPRRFEAACRPVRRDQVGRRSGRDRLDLHDEVAPVTVGTRIRYMGNKQQLAGEVAVFCESISDRRRLVDLFGGMGSVAGAAAASGRNVWVNDIQSYAQLATRCLLASSEQPPLVDEARRALLPAYRRNLGALGERLAAELESERHVLRRGDVEGLRRLQGEWRHAGNDADVAAEVRALRHERDDGPCRLATLLFAWGYFGLRQAVELDSIRHAIDDAQAHEIISAEHADWLRLAWLQTASRIASAPGHFAQFLRPTNAAGALRIVTARRRAAWDSLLDDISTLQPYGDHAWRAQNHILGQDALTIWPELDALEVGPAIYYADPPYSKDHYSRYYHVLETLTRYDYPDADGAGRYRPDRFRSTFAVKTEVVGSVRTIAQEIAARDGILLLSYPSSGLLTAQLGIDPTALLGEYFDDVQLAISRAARHSTLGARHGAASQDVIEYVWAAR